MTIEGLFNSLSRAIKKQFSKLFNRKKNKTALPEVPAAWKKGKQKTKKNLAAGPRVRDPDVQEFMTRKVYHVPLIKTIKRITAGVLLFINFTISQFLLASGTDSAPAFILFLMNSFILLDYLWKTRAKGGEQLQTA